MRIFISILTILAAMLAIMSCEDNFLDRKIDTNYTEEQVFANYNTMRDFGIGIYTYLPAGFNRINGAMLAAATDDAVHSGTGTDIQSLTNGSWGPFNNPDDHWAHFYSGIRKANLFLENTVKYQTTLYRDTITDEGRNDYRNQTNDIRWLRAEARVLRAFFYFELIKRYGGVPLITETLEVNNDYNISRSTFDDCMSFITSEIDAAEEGLRLTWAGFEDDKNIGRANWGVALALKARALLYFASPLHNKSNDVARWKAAASAAHDLIDLNQYNLAADYEGLFRAIINDEIIFARRYPGSNSLERSNYPVGFEGAVGGTNPTQDLVNAYQTTNGLSIEEDPAYDPQNPYENRDPRLTMTIIVNDSDYKNRAVETFDGGKDGPDKPRGSRTGYYLKKYSDEGLDLLQNTTSVHTWIYFRYAEVLLNYAEAMNEAYGPDDNAGFSMTAREALNTVRHRTSVNMPEVLVANKEAFREALRNERRVELAFEEHRFWDVRRWKIAEKTIGTPVHGVDIEAMGNGQFLYKYPEAPVEDRVFESQMYLYPLPQSEIIKTSGSLDQTDGW
ncbi:RagB/SusD family nutrient uptake outer membrane protein [Fulvivirga sediminis]|uniref:RagB/SusD family nutrient uptake outer membrane protein n=1 Tax=Fulvivirga sediminis TaxID=2803949 RepID=A0A937K0B3_9BACT|nr:RagB/SusD family nutrient uptake outer membrane protein [Fulvivirga sediminis]MBL3655347.1 RagB/SusD family nutrient uptake outer membrane protein [Fulvivirga sediminis]